MRIDVLWAIMSAEMRMTRRLLRYWIFAVLAVTAGVGVFLYYCGLHAFFSSYSATAASIGPRYLISAMGLYFLLFFMVGLVFLGFDIRARDRREGVVEVLDCRPISNAELLTGRFLGQLLMAWIPAVIMVLLMEGLGFLLPALGAPIGETLEPWSLIGFLLIMCLPALAWALAVTYFITLLVRHRLAASLLSILVIGGGIWVSFRLPPVWSVFFDVGGAYIVTFPSDMVPGLVDLQGFLQRSGILILAGAFLALAVLVHPRLDSTRKGKKLAVAFVSLIFGLGILGMSAVPRFLGQDQIHRWRAAHEALQDQPRPDILKISGKVGINPGGDLREDLNLTVSSATDLETMVFSLNPGLEISELTAAGRKLEYQQGDGLLEVSERLSAGETMALHLVAEGALNTDFGYLDSSRTPEELPAYQAQLFLLGFRRAINDSRCVALMPGVAWLPISGVDLDRGKARDQGRDFFDLDLNVELPDQFLVAGPGLGEDESIVDGRRHVRFRPGAPLDGVALIASRFIKKEMTIKGVQFKLLLSPKHASNFEALDGAMNEIRSRVSRRIDQLHQAGLDYPYSALSLVEVPNSLRGFGGGWRLASVLDPPGMILLRELGFPTARFDIPFRDPAKFKDREGGVASAQADRLEEFFINDFSGGNLFSGVGRSMLLAQTGCRGEGSAAVEWSLDSVETLLLSGVRSYFSAHLFSPEMNRAIGGAIQHFVLQGRKGHFADSVIEVFQSRPQVWSAVLKTELSKMEPCEHPQESIDALSLKAGALSQAIFDTLGPEGSSALTAHLRSRFHGECFTLDDYIQSLGEENPQLALIADNLIRGRGLPGFTCRRTELDRIADDGEGLPQYQLLLEIANPEDAPGVFRLHYALGDSDSPEIVDTKPIPIESRSAVRYTTVLSGIPRNLLLEPYISLNREAFQIPLPEVKTGVKKQQDGVEGIETVPIEKEKSDSVTVDDLDENFSIEGGDGASGFRLRAKKAKKEELDCGLPVDDFGPVPARWSRATRASAWGQYRHTVVWTRKGKGLRKAVFKAEIPKSGEWQLEIHLPSKSSFPFTRKWGCWNMNLVGGGNTRSLSFDAENANGGWNLVDVFRLEAGEIKLEIPDSGSGMVVIADAVRFNPTSKEGNEG